MITSGPSPTPFQVVVPQAEHIHFHRQEGGHVPVLGFATRRLIAVRMAVAAHLRNSPGFDRNTCSVAAEGSRVARVGSNIVHFAGCCCIHQRRDGRPSRYRRRVGDRLCGGDARLDRSRRRRGGRIPRRLPPGRPSGPSRPRQCCDKRGSYLHTSTRIWAPRSAW